jgi:hypothetical protein
MATRIEGAKAAESVPVGSGLGAAAGLVATGTEDWSTTSSSRMKRRRSSQEIGEGAGVGGSLESAIVHLDVYGAVREPRARDDRPLLELRGGIIETRKGGLKKKFLVTVRQ